MMKLLRKNVVGIILVLAIVLVIAYMNYKSTAEKKPAEGFVVSDDTIALIPYIVGGFVLLLLIIGIGLFIYSKRGSQNNSYI